jgi:multidrug efflux system membrane fusion protein
MNRILATLATVLFLFACARKPAATPPAAAIPVAVANVTQQAMPVEIAAVGNVQPVSTVSIRPQISGQLLEVHFKEGDFVRKGQLLLTLDSRPYQAEVEKAKGAMVRDQAQIAQAQANLAKDSAQEDYLRAEAQRYSALWDKGLIPRESLEQIKSQASSAEQALSADRATIDTARANLGLDQSALNAANVQLSYCNIYSPMDGRTGAVLQKPGNLLKAADVPVVVINQVDPIYVDFTVPQQYWNDIQKHIGDNTLRAKATVPQNSDAPEEGSVTFVDSAIDAQTGTLHLRATFENSHNRLWPGLFVNTSLRLSEQPNAIVIPSQAITQGQNGAFVYIVKSDNSVETRPIASSRESRGFAVIDQGLNPGEVVVVDGQARLAQGSKVQIKTDSENAVEQAANGGRP